jgi:hypothetical protein
MRRGRFKPKPEKLKAFTTEDTEGTEKGKLLAKIA